MPVVDLLIGDVLLGGGLPLATFALDTATAGFAGVLVAPVFAIDPQLGSRFIIKAFAVIIVGGMAVVPARTIAALVESYNHGNGVNLLALVVAVICCSSNQAMHFLATLAANPAQLRAYTKAALCAGPLRSNSTGRNRSQHHRTITPACPAHPRTSFSSKSWRGGGIAKCA